MLGVECWMLDVECWMLNVLDVERVMGCVLCVMCYVLCVMCCVLRVMCCVLRVMCCVTDIERTCRVSRKYVVIFPCPICMYLFEARRGVRVSPRLRSLRSLSQGLAI